MNADQQRLRAAGRTAADKASKGIDDRTKRMAGAAVVAMLAPGVLSAVDNQEENLGQQVLSGAITLGAAGLGAEEGLRSATFLTDADKEEFIAKEMDNLKKEMKQVSKEQGVQAGVEFFAKGKERILRDLEPVLSNAQARNLQGYARMTGGSAFEDVVQALKLDSRSPRQLRRGAIGAAIGAGAGLLPAYMALRGGEIED